MREVAISKVMEADKPYGGVLWLLQRQSGIFWILPWTFTQASDQFAAFNFGVTLQILQFLRTYQIYPNTG
jgi:hypothetical protein